MMTAELPLGLFIILGRKAVPLAHLVKRTDERPISMMMAELSLGLSIILGGKTVSLAHLVKQNRRAADFHDDGRAPSWALHNLG